MLGEGQGQGQDEGQGQGEGDLPPHLAQYEDEMEVAPFPPPGVCVCE